MLKLIVHWLACFLISPILLIYLLFSPFTIQDSLFTSISQLLSLIPGKIGSYLRIAFYTFTMTNCNKNCMICFGTLFAQTDTEIQHGVYIGPQSNIGSSSIGANCLLGSSVHILSGKRQHNYSKNDVPLKDQGGTLEKITIGENTWIGNGAIIMANIGKNCVVGAGSIVTHHVADNSIMSGNPATLIKQKSS